MTTTKFQSNTQVFTSEDVPTLSETLTDRRIRWSNLLRREHYQPIISEVLDQELPKYQNSTVVDATDRVSHMRECALILASAPLVFAAAVDGSLIRRMSSDSAMRKEYALVQQRAYSQPSIYIHLLADRNGIAPTPNQYLIVSDIVQDYLAEGQSSSHAWQLDNITTPFVSKTASDEGHRKYLHTSIRSPRRVETFKRFIQGVQRRWLQTPPALRDSPFQFPPGECGYSRNSHVRLAQHRAHQSSNYVMNLVEDICTYLHRTGRLEQHFLMHQFIMYLIFRPEQAAIAEIFCSGLLQVWVDGGGGFNAHPAGLSVATVRRVSSGEWAEHERSTRELSPVEENMRVQKDRAAEWIEALNWEDSLEQDKVTADDDK